MKEIFYKHTTRYNNKMRSVSNLLYGISSITSLSHFLPECIYLHVYLLHKYESSVHRQYVLSCFSRVWLWRPPGSPVHGILEARIPEWVAISCPGTEPTSLMSPALAGGFFTPSATWDDTPEPVSFFPFLLFWMCAVKHLMQFNWVHPLMGLIYMKVWSRNPLLKIHLP